MFDFSTSFKIPGDVMEKGLFKLRVFIIMATVRLSEYDRGNAAERDGFFVCWMVLVQDICRVWS